MKKHHIINQSTGKCFCGINPDNQLIAFNDGSDWYDSKVYPIDHTNYNTVLCVNCMKQFDIDLIAEFEMKAFLIDYNNRLPKTGRAMKFFKAQSRRIRQSIDRSKPIIKADEKPTNQSKSKSPDKPIIQSDKGKARAARKAANQSKKANQSKPSDDKCKVIAKPDQSKDDKPIELVDEIKPIERKPLIDLSNGPVLIETIEEVDPNDNWTIGDPIDDDTIFEMAIGNDWKLIRHSKKLNQWKFVNRQVVKGIPKWIDDSEFIDYTEAAQLINDGYCE
jgi:hypothetical protein